MEATAQTSEIPLKEQEIIISAIHNADLWRASRLKVSRDAITANGVKWNEAHKKFVYDYAKREHNSQQPELLCLRSAAQRAGQGE